MPRRGKERSALAPIKEIVQSLELTQQEGRRLRALTLKFLKKTKKLLTDDIIRLKDDDFYDLAREFLATETTPRKGPTGSEFWPIDQFGKALAYEPNRPKVIKHVSYIMRNQRKNLLSEENRRRRENPAGVENNEPPTEAGQSNMAGANPQTNPESDMDEGEGSQEGSRDSPEFETVTEIITSAREPPAEPNRSGSTDPSSHLATPPITPAASSSMRQRQTFHEDNPRPSVELSNTTTTVTQNFPPQRSLQSTTNLRGRRRERSPSTFAAYNPRLPTHRDGTLDRSSVKPWKDGLEFAKDMLNKFNWSLSNARQDRILAGDHDTASALEQQRLGLGHFLEFLEAEVKKQERRLEVSTTSRMALAGAPEGRGATRTLSPQGH